MKLKHKTNVLIAKTRKLIISHLKNIYSIIPHTPTIRSIKRTDNLEQRSLAGTTRSNNRHNFPFFDCHTHITQNMQLTVRLINMFYFNHLQSQIPYQYSVGIIIKAKLQRIFVINLISAPKSNPQNHSTGNYATITLRRMYLSIYSTL